MKNEQLPIAHYPLSIIFLLLYNLLFTIAFLLALPYLIYKLLTDKSVEWRQRLGIFKPEELPPPGCIWLHAASMGEVVAAVPLIREIQKRRSQTPIFFTTMTRTGQQRAKDLFGDAVYVAFMPFDTFWAIAFLYRRICPTALLLVETELWFNLIAQARHFGVRLFVVNGRLTEKSLAYYRYLAWGIGPILANFEHFYVQLTVHKSFFERLGAPADRITVAGNTKYDSLRQLPLVDLAQLRHEFGISDNEFIIVAGSTRPGEEALLIPVIKACPQFKWIFVPRHLERLSEIEDLFRQNRIDYRRSSQIPNEKAPIILVDTMGKLFQLYAIARIAFVGGTLVDFGGHNLLEPAAWGVCVVHGVYTANCRDQAEALAENGGSFVIKTAEDFVQFLQQDRLNEITQQKGLKAQATLAKLTGATATICKIILPES